ncbi:methionyl-tRNA formyltransferase [Bifidobacterium bombi]|uniref:Methionyl-tRNA formyltransferase n=1 Tax=Bifidobacterium bombi DSM 19703 TaxID=1341695 RepID=A0A086BNY1_9BIFI|nr:methionyl-tRNA formyltransferase [Bifidobacterium bombi]KFF30645.1 methionyl-tRNA formyltransferase [Bifidobacterium bombi DSM 19703]
MLRVLFAGTPEAAVPALETLAADTEHFEVVAVLTRPDAVRGRGRRLSANPVKQAARSLDIPVLECDPSEPSFLDELKATGAQAGAIVAYGKILRQPVLDALPMGWYNLHFSLLPQWRGAAPVQRAIWSGDSLTGATVFRLTAGMDTGPILAQSTLEIGKHDTSGDVLRRLSQEGARLLEAALQAMADGQIALQEQPQGAYEVARKITSKDARIRFDVPAFAADRQIRACTPDPGAWTMLHLGSDIGTTKGNGRVHTIAGAKAGAEVPEDSSQASVDAAQMLHVLRAHVVEEPDTTGGSGAVPQTLEPGKLFVTKKHVWVGTLSAPLELDEVKLQGKKAMPAADWARGAHLGDGAYLE